MGLQTEYIDEYQTVWPAAYVRIEKVVLNKRNKDCWFDFTIYSEQNKRPLKTITVGIEGKLFDRYFFVEEMNIGALAYFYLKHLLKAGYYYDGQYKHNVVTIEQVEKTRIILVDGVETEETYMEDVEVITPTVVTEAEATESMFPSSIDI
jgi:hypothetical protein